MKNLLLLSMITFIACTTTSVKPTKEIALPEIQTPANVTSFVNVIKYSNFTDKEKVKASKYIPVMDKVINSKCFMDFMVMRELKKTNGKTNKEVVEHIRTSTVDIELIMYYKRFSKVAGYTKPNVNKIWLNRKYHSGASNCSEASNLTHELSHKIKYGHDYNATIDRPLSVPYSINAAFKSCCK